MVINIEAKGKDIHLFGRTYDGTPIYEIDKSFVPYFYVAASDGRFTSIFGERARKVELEHPGQTKTERQKYPKTFEADVTYVNRYLIDKYEILEKEPLRILYLDIECLTDDGAFPSPQTVPSPITVVGCYDSFKKKYVQFVYSPNYEVNQSTEQVSIFYCKTEEAMLTKFMQFMQAIRPDVICTWNGDDFDYPYLVNRVNKIGLDANEMSPMKEVYSDEDRTKIRGITLFDMFWGYKRLTEGGRESNSLDFIGQYELGMGKISYTGTTDDLWKQDIEKLLEYNRRDVEILYKLDAKLGMIEFFDEIRRMSKSTFGDILMNSRVIDFYILDFCKHKGLILPTREHTEGEEIEGAVVLEPVKGLHRNVCVGDLKSLYPSIIISANLSPETLSPTGDIKLGNGVAFNSSSPGIMPTILQELFKTRSEAKKKFKETKELKYHNKQYAVKILMNSFYGVLGHHGYRLYRREIADSITWFGRQTIMWTKKELEGMEFKVVAGDTDSVFWISKEDSLEHVVSEAKTTIMKINQSYSEFAKQYGITNHILELQFEKVYKTVFFQGAKKRYAGLIQWKDGEVVDEVDIKGYESRRSDTPYISRKLQKDVFRMILEDKPKEEVFEFVKGFCNDVREGKYKPEEIALPIGVSTNPYEYKNLPIHIRATQLANTYHKANIKAGDKIRYIYVKRTPRGIPFQNVIAFTEKLWPGYEVDIEQQLERIVFMKLDGIFDGLGWNISELKGQRSLDAWLT